MPLHTIPRRLIAALARPGALVLPVALLLSSPLAAQQDPTAWTFGSDIDPSTGAATGFAVLGMPNNGDRALSLFCSVRPGQPMQIMADVTADLSVSDSSVPVTLQWRSDTGSGTEAGVSVIGGAGEGISLELSLPSAFMTALQTGQWISWFETNASSQQPLTVPLTGNRAAVLDFVDHCAQIQQTQGGTASAVPATGAFAGLVPDVGPAFTGHDWSRVSDIREDIFQTFLGLSFGVGETDDVLVDGRCLIGAQGPLVTLQVGADIEGFADGSPVTLRATSADGRSVDMPGSVVGAFAEFGVSGVEVTLEVSDPAWQVIAGHPTVAFERVGGRGGFTLTGNGPATIGPFLRDCDGIGELTPAGAQPPVRIDQTRLGFFSCESFGQLVSAQEGAQTSVTFVNNSGMYRALAWIDTTGAVIDMGGMNPGESMGFTSTQGHVWMVSDGPGDCLEMIRPEPGQTTYHLQAQ